MKLKLHTLFFVIQTFALSAGLATVSCSDDGSSDNTGGAAGSPSTSGGSSNGSGGNNPGSGGQTAALPPTKAVDELTNASADNYAHNRWGLIEASTLESYAKNWKTADSAASNASPDGRPKHLSEDARLVILQLNAADRNDGDYVPSNLDSKVYVYELDEFRFNETRDTGLISNSVRYQASGETTDTWLSNYGIDLSRDFVVFAVGNNTASNGAFFQELARAIYWLQYWGADLNHLAIVNGSLNKNYDGELSTNKITPGSISNDGFSVRDLRTDNTSLTIPLEDFQKVVDEELEAEGVIEGFSEQFIIDARPTPQFKREATGSFNTDYPGQFITTAWDSTGAPSNDDTGRAKNYVLFEGHVKGAVSFPWAALVEDADPDTESQNWKYKSKSALTTLFSNAGYEPEDAEDKVIVSQCRTNFEVQVNGFAARVILGYPTVHYDGSLVEYFSLVSNHPTASFNIATTDAAYKYRTDTSERSQLYTPGDTGKPATTTENDAGVPAYNVPSGGTTASDRKVSQAVINRSATTTRLALDADREYKRITDK